MSADMKQVQKETGDAAPAGKIIKLEYDGVYHYCSQTDLPDTPAHFDIFLLLDAVAQFNLRARQEDFNAVYDKHGKRHSWELQDFLVEVAGAKYVNVECDSVRFPSFQAISLKTGMRLAVYNHIGGKLEDMAANDEAVQEFNPETGRKQMLWHYKNGKLFHSPEEPAIQIMDPETRMVIEARNEKAEALPEEDIAALNIRKNLMLSLPEGLDVISNAVPVTKPSFS